MTCSHCGTELPQGAMFCGECGRPVTSRSARVTPERAPVAAPEALIEPPPVPPQPPVAVEPFGLLQDAPREPIATAPAAVRPAPAPTTDAQPEAFGDLGLGHPFTRQPDSQEAVSQEPVSQEAVSREPVERCVQCDAELSPTDIFCPECGFVRQRPTAFPRPHDTAVLDPFPWGVPPRQAPVSISPPSLAPVEPMAFVEPVQFVDDVEFVEPAQEPERIPEPEPVPEPEPAPEPVPAPAAAWVPPPTLIAVTAPPVSVVPAPATPRAAPAHSAAVSTAGSTDDDEFDIEATRIVDRSARGERFVLQFSTGESVSVTGTGLVGRNPLVEPGEYVDSVVTIIDPGKSVSKTHLEFGQEGGAFWVSDRFSGNGTVVREPDRQPKRCDPGKRYRVVRGTRVDIGEQFFIVS